MTNWVTNEELSDEIQETAYGLWRSIHDVIGDEATELSEKHEIHAAPIATLLLTALRYYTDGFLEGMFKNWRGGGELWEQVESPKVKEWLIDCRNNAAEHAKQMHERALETVHDAANTVFDEFKKKAYDLGTTLHAKYRAQPFAILLMVMKMLQAKLGGACEGVALVAKATGVPLPDFEGPEFALVTDASRRKELVSIVTCAGDAKDELERITELLKEHTANVRRDPEREDPSSGEEGPAGGSQH